MCQAGKNSAAKLRLTPSVWRCIASFLLSAGAAFGTVATPIFAPGDAQASIGFYVSVTCVTSNSSIHYTTNGATPTLADPQVPTGNLVMIQRSLTLKAKAWVGSDTSAVMTADYKVVGDIAAGGMHSMAVKTNQAVYGWGQQEYGRLANRSGTLGRKTFPQLSRRSSTVDFINGERVAAGLKHSVFLDSAGAVHAAGLNDLGQLGDNSTVTPTDFCSEPVVKSTTASDFLTGCIQVSAADNYSAALSDSSTGGKVYTWGSNAFGRLGRIVNGDDLYAKSVKTATSPYSALTGIVQIAAGGNHMLARTAHMSELAGGTGDVWVWGLNTSGQLGLGNTTSFNRATQATILGNISDISAGVAHSAAVKWNSNNQGKVYCFGQQEFGRLGNGSVSSANVATPEVVLKWDNSPLEQIVAVAAGPRHTLALDSNGKVWAWGGNADGELGDNTLTGRGRARLVLDTDGSGSLSHIASIAAGGVDGAGFSQTLR
ncbi:MAG: chitobiase/beta-hexosaminidase C-terminal domain-containing protein [Luteolibacter sp.]|uniref:RCC1 domain-containing protein n=1 Tax=Luteolibacter sp. TaxID=1962973 RepID=UPI003262DFED